MNRFLLSGAACALVAFAQIPQFGLADVHVSANSINAYMRGPFIRGGRYEIRQATMVDLVRTAWGVDEDKVLGGPSWLESDRFDIAAKLPAEPTPENLKLALQALLTERFGLVAHADTRPMPAYLLTAGKKPQMKEADGSGEAGCRNTDQGTGRGGERPPFSVFACRNVTMDKFIADMTGRMGPSSIALQGTPVVDQTGIKGAWDFDVKLSPMRLGGAGPDAENITIFDAVEKQLGLKLTLAKAPLPVVVVESANRRPTANPPGIAQSLPAAPVEFEVADVKPSDRSIPMGRNFNVLPNGRVNLTRWTLRQMIQLAWGLNNNLGNGTITGGPKWLDSDQFDIVAKVAPVESATGATQANTPVDQDAVWLALRGLLAERFKLAVHFEDQPEPVYALVAVKPKLTKADPANRSSCSSPNILKALTASGPGGRPSANTLTCRDVTMAQLAERLYQVSVGDVDHPVVDATGIEGAWDFTFSWTPAIVGQLTANRAKGDSGGGPADGAASDPGTGLSMAQALEKQLGLKLELQKRPLPVLVIDHVEEKPTDN